MGAIFGSKKASSQGQSTSNSGNLAYPQLQGQFTPVAAQAGQAGNALSALLGVGGDPTAQNAAFNNYKNSTGYNFKMDQGQQAITGSQAAKGLLGSGSTGRALTNFGQGLADSTTNDYLSQLFNLGNMGTQAGQLLSGAGQYSNAQSTQSGSSNEKPGIGGFLGQIGAAAVTKSDRGAKRDIVFLRKGPHDLNVYSFRYLWDDDYHVGVMAQEVEVLAPWALGPIEDGYMTVNYAQLGEL